VRLDYTGYTEEVLHAYVLTNVLHFQSGTGIVCDAGFCILFDMKMGAWGEPRVHGENPGCAGRIQGERGESRVSEENSVCARRIFTMVNHIFIRECASKYNNILATIEKLIIEGFNRH
jgi:hypothetical protein